MHRSILLLAIPLVLVAAAPAAATNFPVTRSDDPAPGGCDPGDCSLREAFMAAEAAGGPDSIGVPPGTYRLTLSVLPTVTQNLTVNGTDAASTVITGSLATGGSVTSRGGAILHTGGDLTLSKLTFRGNASEVSNPATQSVNRGAGAILSDSSGMLTLVDSVVTGNQNRAPGNLGAGGLFANNLTLTNTRVSGNVSTSPSGTEQVGGVAAGSISMTDSTIHGNTAGGSSTLAAGGLAVGTGSIQRSTISGNGAAVGQVTIAVGGLENSQADLTNTTITDNSASGNSVTLMIGGLDAGGTFTVRNSTIARNTAGDVGNVRVPGGTTVASTIVAEGTPNNCTAVGTSGGGNVEDANTCGFSPATGDKVDTNPLLGPLADNGGPTQTLALAAGSPAVDAVPAGNTCPPTDQRGIGRPVGPACDSGAFEFVPPPVIPAPPPASPVNTAPPAIGGSSKVGDMLSCQPGTWTGDPAFIFAWLRNGAPIAGAAGPAYTLTPADRGTAIQCQVTGSNDGGQSVATSAPVVATSIANRSRPAILGTVRVGKRVRCAPGTWTGKPSFAFAWLRDGKKIGRAATSRYKLTRRDRGHALQCRVTGRKAGISVVAESRPKVVKPRR